MAAPPEKHVEAIGYHLREINHMLKRHLAVLLAAEGLTLPQMIVLRKIRERGEITLGEIAADLHLAPSTLSGIIKRLEREGLVEKEVDPHDLRIVRLRASPKADSIIQRTSSIYNTHLSAVLSHFTAEELDILLSSLRKLKGYVEEEDPSKLLRGDQL